MFLRQKFTTFKHIHENLTMHSLVKVHSIHSCVLLICIFDQVFLFCPLCPTVRMKKMMALKRLLTVTLWLEWKFPRRQMGSLWRICLYYQMIWNPHLRIRPHTGQLWKLLRVLLPGCDNNSRLDGQSLFAQYSCSLCTYWGFKSKLMEYVKLVKTVF